jgi:calcineurin-like phosphoesterase family protein
MEWVTSDHHFKHFNIIKYCNRPFNDAHEMDEEMIKRWNKVVQPKDTVYHLGDFAFFGGNVDVLKGIASRLNGYKILIRGNHDRKMDIMIKGGFDEVYDRLVIDEPNRKLLMTHRRTSPMPTLNVSVELWNYYPIPLPTVVNQPLHLCGHSHDLWTVTEKYMTQTEQEIAKDSIEIWRNMEERVDHSINGSDNNL